MVTPFAVILVAFTRAAAYAMGRRDLGRRGGQDAAGRNWRRAAPDRRPPRRKRHVYSQGRKRARPRTKGEEGPPSGTTYAWTVTNADSATGAGGTGVPTISPSNAESPTLTAGRTSVGTSKVEVQVQITSPTANGGTTVVTRTGTVTVIVPNVRIRIIASGLTSEGWPGVRGGDDLVELTSTVPPEIYWARAEATLTEPPPEPLRVVLTSSESRLGFTSQSVEPTRPPPTTPPAPPTPVLNLPLDLGGKPATFYISGNTASTAIGDAVIVPHSVTATGPTFTSRQ